LRRGGSKTSGGSEPDLAIKQEGDEMRRYAIAAAALLTVAAVEAGANDDWLIGNLLAKFCNESQGYAAGVCAGYVVGVADAMIRPEWPYSNAKACFANGMETGQLIGATKKYLTDHPEQLHFAAFELVAVALAAAFPCGRVSDQPKM
jgi:hypothetical protein